MGKPNWNDLFAKLQQSITAATAPSTYETQLGQQWQNTQNFLNSNDYRNLPSGVGVDLLPAADYQKMRQMMMGRNNGTSAAGVINPTILNQQRELGDQQATQDWGSSYENSVANLRNQNMNLAGALQGQYSNRMNTGLQGAMGALSQYNQRPQSMWSSLVPGLISGAAHLI